VPDWIFSPRQNLPPSALAGLPGLVWRVVRCYAGDGLALQHMHTLGAPVTGWPAALCAAILTLLGLEVQRQSRARRIGNANRRLRPRIPANRVASGGGLRRAPGPS
jgi:hypothetical protein